FAAVMFCDTVENCGWLNALKASTRNCSDASLGSEQFLKKPKPRLLMPGPRRGARPELPEEPSAGWAKAALLNLSSIVPPPEWMSPTMSARLVPKLSATPPTAAANTDIGK